jgi:hypothetical protein
MALDELIHRLVAAQWVHAGPDPLIEERVEGLPEGAEHGTLPAQCVADDASVPNI